MEIQAIKRAYECAAIVPKIAIRAAIACPEIADMLLEILQDLAKNPQNFVDPDRRDHLLALYTIARLADVRAFPYIIYYLQWSRDDIDDIFGDVYDAFSQFLVSTYDGAHNALIDVINNAALDVYSRNSAMVALLSLYVRNRIPKEIIINCFKSLFQAALEQNTDDDDTCLFNGMLIDSAVNLCDPELCTFIQQLFDGDRVDTGYIALEDVHADLGQGEQACKQKILNDKWSAPITEDIIPDILLLYQDHGELAALVGRNDQCPCYSGKKYKKCCENDKDNHLSAHKEEVFRDMLLPQKDADRFFDIVLAIDEYVCPNIDDDNDKRIRVHHEWLSDPKIIANYLLNNKYAVSSKDLSLIQRWQATYITGTFAITKYCQEYALFYNIESKCCYAVKGLKDSFDNIFEGRFIPIVKTRLLPYNDCIIWDGLSEEINKIDYRDRITYKKESEKIVNLNKVVMKF